jgi:glutamyl-Q tRNA(Asp) synthetase
VPRWYHHNLVADRNGMRMAKRNGATTLRHLRSLGHSPADLARLIGVTPPVGAPRGAKQGACAPG